MTLLTTKIKDFQSLHDVEIEHGGVTVLTGQSDLGKSAIIRAMKMLHRNNGTSSFVRHGKSKLKIEQLFSDGTQVAIEKSKTTNNYNVNGKSLAKIGKDVPETAREVLLTDELVLDKDLSCDLNFSCQFDPPFLLAESSTMITKVISSLSGIEIIYSAIREGNSQIQKLKSLSQVLLGNTVALAKYEGLQLEAVGLQSELVSLQSQEKGLQSQEAGIQKLQDLLLKSKVLSAKTVDIEPEEKTLETLSQVHKALNRDEEKIALLTKMGQKYDSLIVLDTQPLEDLYSKINSIFLVVNKQEEAYNQLIKQNGQLNALVKSLENIDSELAALEVEEAQIKANVKFCDKCGRVL